MFKEKVEGKKSVILLISLILLSFLMLEFVSGIEAAYIAKKDINYNLSVSCSNGGFPCDSTASCNITIDSPSSVRLINFQQMSNDNKGRINYFITAENLSEFGYYPASVYCSSGSYNDTSDFFILVNKTGQLQTIPEAIIYFVILIISIGIFVFILVAGFSISSKNEIDMMGLVKVNYGKYAKYCLFGLSYVIFIWLSFFLWNITMAFSYFNAGIDLFKIIYYFSIGAFVPLLCISIFLIFISTINDMKLDKMYKRGLKPR